MRISITSLALQTRNNLNTTERLSILADRHPGKDIERTMSEVVKSLLKSLPNHSRSLLVGGSETRVEALTSVSWISRDGDMLASRMSGALSDESELESSWFTVIWLAGCCSLSCSGSSTNAVSLVVALRVVTLSAFLDGVPFGSGSIGRRSVIVLSDLTLSL